MRIPHTFFDDEIRDGFYVSGVMKRVWAASMEILADIDRICKKHAIKWFADYGTLLGAVRHGGVIPWDDDFDICMLRDDYMRFLEVAKQELPAPYKVLSCHGDYDDLMARIVNTDTIDFDEDFLDKFHQCYFGVGVDIFPLDNMAPTQEERLEHKKEMEDVIACEGILTKGKAHSVDVHTAVVKVNKLCGVTLDTSKDLAKQYYIALEKLCAKYQGIESDRVMLAPIWAKYGSKSYPVSCFKDSILMPFESMKIPVSIDYDTMLKIEYGDYMKILKGGASHGYPCFVRQEQQVIDALPEYPFLYTYRPENLQLCEREEKTKNRKREVVMIPYRASSWSRMESLWKKEKKSGANVRVILPPYYEKNGIGGFTDMHDESTLLPEYVEVIPFDQYDFEKIHPDVIYTQNPYDECNYTSSVHPFYYSENLKKFTDKLIYTPWFSLSDIEIKNQKMHQTMQYFCIVPGLFYADEIILDSESAKQAYVNRLIEITGEGTKDFWEKKIVVDPLLSNEAKLKQKLQKSILKDIPDAWNKIIYDLEGRKKQIVLYEITASAFIKGGYHAIEKIKEVFDLFRNHNTVAFVWRADVTVFDILGKLDTSWKEEYQNLVDEVCQSDWGIYAEDLSFEQAVNLADAFYGDKGYVARSFESVGKPVMIQNIESRQVDEIPTYRNLKRNPNGNIDIHVRACEQVGHRLYYVANEMNVLGMLDLADGTNELLSMIPEEGIHGTELISSIKHYQNKLILIPCNAKKIWIYNLGDETWENICIHDEALIYKFSCAEIYEKYCYVFPNYYKSIIRIDMDDLSITYQHDYYDEFRKMDIGDLCALQSNNTRCGDYLYFVEWNKNLVFKYNLSTCGYEWKQIGNRNRQFTSIAGDGKTFYLSPRSRDTIVKWDGRTKFEEFDIPQECEYEANGLCSVRMYGDEVTILGYNCDSVVFDKDNEQNMRVVPYRYTFHYRVDNYRHSYHALQTNTFYYQDNEQLYTYDLSLKYSQLKEFCNQYIDKNPASLFSGCVEEDDGVDAEYFIACISRQIRKEKRVVVFMPYKASMWDSLESIWLAAKEDSKCETYVVPIPYYDKNGRGELVNYQYDGDKFPSYVPIVDYHEFDLEAKTVDVIYIHNPYDQGNHVTSIDPNYYSCELKKYTNKLVYVPYYATTGGMSEGQALCMAYLNADYIITQSENHHEFFDTKISREKLIPLGSPKFDRVISLCKNPPELPDEWNMGRDKKRYFYNTSLQGMLADTTAFLKKMKYVFSCFEGRDDVCIIWRPHPLFETTLDAVRPEYRETYDEIKSYFIEHQIGILDTSDDIEKTIALCDAYIGDDATSVTTLFAVAGKPLFILNNWIHREPKADDWKKQMVPLYYPQESGRWKVIQGNKLYVDATGSYDYRFCCDLSEDANGAGYAVTYEYDNHVYVFPLYAQNILEIRDGKVADKIEFEYQIQKPGAFYDVRFYEQYAFLIPNKYPYIIRFNMITKEVDYVDGCREFICVRANGEDKLAACTIWKQYLLIASPIDKRILVMDCETMEIQVLEVSAKHYRGAVRMEVGEDEIWLLPYTGTDVVSWNPLTGETREYRCRIKDFSCTRRPDGGRCMEKAFGSVAFTDDRAVLAPMWGNQFVQIEKMTGNVQAFDIDICCEYHENRSYQYNISVGQFLKKTGDETVLYFHELSKEMLEINLHTIEYKKIDISFDYQEVMKRNVGFARQSKWLRYGCYENVFQTLSMFLSGDICGNAHTKEEQLEAYEDIFTNADGTCGKKVHAFIMQTL